MRKFSDLKSVKDLHHAIVLEGDRSASEQEVILFVKDNFGLTMSHQDFYTKSTSLFDVDMGSDFREFMTRKTISGHKVALISASQFSDSVLDSLLKTIEEPSEGTYVFFAVQNADILLATILSRSLVCSSTNKSEQSGAIEDLAQKFVEANIKDRFLLVDSIIKKIEGTSEKAQEGRRVQKEHARIFVGELVKVIVGKKMGGRDSALLVAKLLGTPSPNLGLLFEHLIFAIDRK
ncbi:MAG: hypothetical protein COV07_03050 [Candidatus Vogelbacteria bacterium CG10_big_fil_rev_8_21_14_0_10_45_14]|uniref:DNA polymerase III subunit delta n=1 Tax=Candidatus Vogelbacteria bacterium CG10_big_fil_rev_8_21_14_0_10_45_14 TaxID=1975042 RepID=A0A2H0RJF3_9BACT|nr:MAG: hypothetical protein COV07_03050 [Candidatus Vogelbacteria bacterium CG10_big_fil_rev_8_21_14_0_10_45_14]